MRCDLVGQQEIGTRGFQPRFWQHRGWISHPTVTSHTLVRSVVHRKTGSLQKTQNGLFGIPKLSRSP